MRRRGASRDRLAVLTTLRSGVAGGRIVDRLASVSALEIGPERVDEQQLGIGACHNRNSTAAAHPKCGQSSSGGNRASRALRERASSMLAGSSRTVARAARQGGGSGGNFSLRAVIERNHQRRPGLSAVRATARRSSRPGRAQAAPAPITRAARLRKPARRARSPGNGGAAHQVVTSASGRANSPTKRVRRQNLDAERARRATDAAHRFDSCCARDARQEARLRPAPVAVHDDGDMAAVGCASERAWPDGIALPVQRSP